MQSGSPSQWNQLLANITAIDLPIDFTQNPAEIAGYDNVCLRVRDDCGCMRVETSALDCISGGAGIGSTHTWTFTLTNLSGQSANTLSIFVPPGMTLTPQAFTLNPPLLDGESRTFTMTLSGAPQGAESCFTFILRRTQSGQPPVECCRQSVCLTPPVCCVRLQGTLSPAPLPDFEERLQYCFTVTNVSSFPLHHLFVIDPDPFGPPSFFPSYFSFSPPLAPGATSTTPFCIFINGADPGEAIDFEIEVHDADFDPCCAVPVRLTAPLPEPSCPCPSPCGSTAVPESEACGERRNDFCDLEGPEAQYIGLSQNVCGSVFLEGTMFINFDIDHYYVSVNAGFHFITIDTQAFTNVVVRFVRPGDPCEVFGILADEFVNPCSNATIPFFVPTSGTVVVTIGPVTGVGEVPCSCGAYRWGIARALLACTSDENGDGIIDFSDLAIVINNWGGTGPAGDCDGDGFVGLTDLAAIICEWGRVCP